MYASYETWKHLVRSFILMIVDYRNVTFKGLWKSEIGNMEK